MSKACDKADPLSWEGLIQARRGYLGITQTVHISLHMHLPLSLIVKTPLSHHFSSFPRGHISVNSNLTLLHWMTSSLCFMAGTETYYQIQSVIMYDIISGCVTVTTRKLGTLFHLHLSLGRKQPRGQDQGGSVWEETSLPRYAYSIGRLEQVLRSAVRFYWSYS